MPAIKTRVEPIDRDIAILIDEALSPKAQSAMLAFAAREARDEAIAVNKSTTGREPRYETFVDGREGAPLESVKPEGLIVFEFEVLLDLFAWIGAQLVKHSPVLTGQYQASHQFYADGVAVDPGMIVPDAQEYVFVSLVPYARKIERGQSPQAPDGVYQVVAKMARSRFGNVARITFGYRTPVSGGIHDWASTTRMASRSSGARRAEWLRRQPAIIITLGTGRS